VVATCIGLNVIASDQYTAIVLPGRMFRAEFDRRGLLPVALVQRGRRFGYCDIADDPVEQLRRLHGGGAGGPTLSYAGFAFFSPLNPLATIVMRFSDLGCVARKQPSP
jgi:NhaC family Na+:H+ antiporter